MNIEMPKINIKCCLSQECIELLPRNYSPPIYSYTFGVLFNSLLAELPGGEPQSSGEKHTSSSDTFIWTHGAVDSFKSIAKSVDNVTI